MGFGKGNLGGDIKGNVDFNFVTTTGVTTALELDVTGQGVLNAVSTLEINTRFYFEIDGIRFPTSPTEYYLSTKERIHELNIKYNNSLKIYKSTGVTERLIATYTPIGERQIAVPMDVVSSAVDTLSLDVSGFGKVTTIGASNNWVSVDVDGVFVIGTSSIVGAQVGLNLVLLDMDFKESLKVYNFGSATNVIVYEIF